MKLSILIVILISTLLLVQVNSEQTILTYIIEYQLDQSDQYVQLDLTVTTEGKSLKKGIADAAKIIQDIQKIAKKYCLEHSKAKKECEEIFEATKYEVEPKYHLVRKVETFTLFIINHEVTIKIRNIPTLGKMIDQIVSLGGGQVMLTSFAWKTEKEEDPEINTLREGIQEGKELCQKLGKKLTGFISVYELQLPEQDEEEVDQQRDEDLAEEQIELTAFKFKVKCDDPVKKEKKTK